MRIPTTANHLDSAGGLERTHLTNAQRLARRGHRFDREFQPQGAQLVDGTRRLGRVGASRWWRLRSAGSPEILTHWMRRRLAAPDDPDDLVRHLLEVLDWHSDDPELGQRCRHAAEERLSLHDEVDLIEVAMLSALERRRS